jgi:hypothetical protein
MRAIALILSVIGLLAMMLVADLNVMPVVPLHLGSPESGAFVARASLFGGLAVSIAATLFAFVHFWANRKSTKSLLLVAWCAVLCVGFVLLYTH